MFRFQLPINKHLFMLIALLTLTGCSSSIQPVGQIGPNNLRVFSITQNDFLSSSHMLVILNKNGEVAAYTGGTVAGGGTVGLQTAATVASASALVYGANTIEHGLQHAKVSGIPSSVNANINANLTTGLDKFIKPIDFGNH